MKRERERKKGEGFAFGMRRLLRVSSPSLYCRLALSCCVVLCSFNLPLPLSQRQRQRVIDFLNRASERRRRRRSEGWAIHKALFSRNLNCVKSPPSSIPTPSLPSTALTHYCSRSTSSFAGGGGGHHYHWVGGDAAAAIRR